MPKAALPLLLALAALVPARAHAARVLFVSDAGADTGIASALEADGHVVQSVLGDFASGNPALRGDLSSYDVVYWSANGSGAGDEHRDPGVFANLAAFVTEGGRVFVTGYDSVASPTDPLLIAFLGATGSTDVPPAPGPIANVSTSLTTGRIDIRGLTPAPLSSDRDTLTGLSSGTIEIVGTPGGSGSHWTLRRLGRGEIAYVSNGDYGASSTASWTTSSADGAGVYNAAVRNFAAASGLSTPAPSPPARSGGRRARVMYLLASSSPAVLVAPDRAWVPAAPETPLSLCAGERCRPVREVASCAPPRCPGHGVLVVASDRVADVSDFPTGRDDWSRERDLLATDPQLSALWSSLGSHPEPAPSPGPPPSFVRAPSDWLQFELRLEGGVGYLASAGVGVGQISAGIGVRFQPPAEDVLDVLYGTMMGVDAVVHVLPAVTGQGTESSAVLVGLAPAFHYAFARERVRIPPAWAWVLPELGVAIRTDAMPVSYYVAWSLSAAVLVDDHAGFDLRARVMLVDDWIPGEDVEAIVSLTAGLLVR
jgi:hypothetical protein